MIFIYIWFILGLIGLVMIEYSFYRELGWDKYKKKIDISRLVIALIISMFTGGFILMLAILKVISDNIDKKNKRKEN